MGYLNNSLKKDRQAGIGFSMLWSIIAVFISFSINLLVTPYVTNIAGAEAYGFVTLANTLTSYIDVVAITINAFAARYISIAFHRGELLEAKIYFNSVVLSNIFLSGVILLICTFFIARIEELLNISVRLVFDVKILFLLVLARYILSMITTSFSVGTFITSRLDLSEKQKSISFVLQGGILLVLFAKLPMHIWYVGLATLIATIWLFLSNIYYTRLLTPELTLNFKFFDIRHVMRLLTSGIWNGINNLGNVLNNGLNLLMTNLMISGQVMGQVSIGISLGTMFNVLLEAITNPFRPRFLFLYAKNEKDSLILELTKAMKITGMLTNIVFAGYVSCGYQFMQLWVPSQNTKFVYDIAVIVLLGSIIVGIVKPLYYVFTITDKLKLPCVITVTSGILNVVLMYVLLKNTDIGAYAVVLTTLVLNLIHLFDTPLYAAYCLKIKLTTFYPTIVRLFISCFLTTIAMKGIGMVLPNLVSWKSLILRCLICGFIGLIVALLSAFNKKELKSFFHLC